jgi:hypothetical protein
MYNKFNAFAYELILFLCRFYPLKRNPFIQRILQYCLDDWCAFRAEIVMQEVDEQIADLHAAWDAEQKEKQKPIYSESAPDGSKAQELLGGSMRLSSPWSASKHELSDPHA